MESIEDIYELDRVLVYGIGGSGDIVGSLPTARLLEQHGVETILGGIAWERLTKDPKPGPRRLGEIESIRPVSSTVGVINKKTQTAEGVRFAESEVAAQVENQVVLLDITKGVTGLVNGIQSACEELDIDGIIGTDSGGDVLADGTEPGLRSPLADGMAVATLYQLEIDTCIGMFGYGSDGELSLQEIDERLSKIAGSKGLLGAWGLTPRIAGELTELLENINTEASRLPVEAFRGEMGRQEIRDGSRDLDLTPSSTVTFYVDPATILDYSDIPRQLLNTSNIEEAEQVLLDAGYPTELTSSKKQAEEVSDS